MRTGMNAIWIGVALLAAACSGAGSGGGDAADDGSKTLETQALDFNADGKTDLLYRVQALDGQIVGGLLLSEGNDQFLYYEAADASKGLPDPGADVWVAKLSASIDDLKKSATGLVAVINGLPDQTLGQLGTNRSGDRSVTDLDQCEWDHICFWDNAGYGGGYYAVGAGASESYVGWFNDKMSSFWNRTPVQYCLYEDAGFSGRPNQYNEYWMFKVYPWGQNPWIGGDLNDRMSSLQPCS